MKKLLALLLICMPALGADLDSAERISARLAITDMISEYSYRWDGKRSADFAELFTEDAVLERWINGVPVAAARLEGKQAILDYAIESHGGRLADRQSRHHMSGIRILELRENEALTEHMALITHQTAADPAPMIRSSVIYRINWRRTQDGWRMSRRILLSDSVGN